MLKTEFIYQNKEQCGYFLFFPCIWLNQHFEMILSFHKVISCLRDYKLPNQYLIIWGVACSICEVGSGPSTSLGHCFNSKKLLDLPVSEELYPCTFNIFPCWIVVSARIFSAFKHCKLLSKERDETLTLSFPKSVLPGLLDWTFFKGVLFNLENKSRKENLVYTLKRRCKEDRARLGQNQRAQTEIKEALSEFQKALRVVQHSYMLSIKVVKSLTLIILKSCLDMFWAAGSRVFLPE